MYIPQASWSWLVPSCLATRVESFHPLAPAASLLLAPTCDVYHGLGLLAVSCFTAWASLVCACFASHSVGSLALHSRLHVARIVLFWVGYAVACVCAVVAMPIAGQCYSVSWTLHSLPFFLVCGHICFVFHVRLLGTSCAGLASCRGSVSVPTWELFVAEETCSLAVWALVPCPALPCSLQHPRWLCRFFPVTSGASLCLSVVPHETTANLLVCVFCVR